MTPDGASRGVVVVVDDEPANLRLLTRLLTAEGYQVQTAADGLTAIDTIFETLPDIILLDVQLPGLNGFEVCRRVKQNPATRFTPVILVTGLNAREHRLDGINAGADDFLNKPFDSEELRARVKSLVRLKRYTDELDSAESVIRSLALTVEARDPYTDGHCQRITSYAVALGESLQLPAEDLAALFRGGYLHDVGKIGIPDAVLQKPGLLTPSEFELMKQHTVIGERLCGDMRSLRSVKSIVRHHHERIDGSGYPDGLTGDAVPLLAQIVSIADIFDAVTTTRPYRVSNTPEYGYAELLADANRGALRFDLVEAFVALGRSGRLAEVAGTALFERF